MPRIIHFDLPADDPMRAQKFYGDVFKYCKTCEVCQKVKNHTHPPKASLGVWPEAGVWERIHIDMLGPLPKTKEGYQYILLV